MNKDFWKRIDRLEELAGKATQGEWVISTGDGIDWGDLSVTTEDRNKDDMVEIALIDNAYLRADETWTDFQIEQNANACYIAAANPAMILEMIAEMRRLEKEADWLARELCCRCHNYGCDNCGWEKCPAGGREQGKEWRQLDWREAARKAVSEDENGKIRT